MARAKYFFLIQFILFFSCKKIHIERVDKINTDSVMLYQNANTIIAYGTVIDISISNEKDHGFCWSNNTEPTIEDNCVRLGDVKANTSFNSRLINLIPGRNYYIRAFISSGTEVKYGRALHFLANFGSLNLRTDTILINSIIQATAYGSISGLGSYSLLDYGHCWSIGGTPTINDSKTSNGVLSNDLYNFLGLLNNLQTETNYSVRTYAKVDANTVYYSTTKYFKIDDLKITTDTAIIISPTIADLKGTIISTGVLPITDHGHCWATTTSYPTINNNKISLGATVSVGQFTSTLNGLNTGTTYYYRAYAIAGGTVKYGSIKKLVH